MKPFLLSKLAHFESACMVQFALSEEEIIQCSNCDTVFRHKTSLHYHVSHKVCLKPKKDEMEPKVLKCEQCEKIFSTTTALTYHVKHNVCAPKEPKEPKGSGHMTRKKITELKF